MIAYPLRLQSPEEAKQLDGIGSWIVSRLSAELVRNGGMSAELRSAELQAPLASKRAHSESAALGAAASHSRAATTDGLYQPRRGSWAFCFLAALADAAGPLSHDDLMQAAVSIAERCASDAGTDQPCPLAHAVIQSGRAADRRPVVSELVGRKLLARREDGRLYLTADGEVVGQHAARSLPNSRASSTSSLTMTSGVDLSTRFPALASTFRSDRPSSSSVGLNPVVRGQSSDGMRCAEGDGVMRRVRSASDSHLPTSAAAPKVGPRTPGLEILASDGKRVISLEEAETMQHPASKERFVRVRIPITAPPIPLIRCLLSRTDSDGSTVAFLPVPFVTRELGVDALDREDVVGSTARVPSVECGGLQLSRSVSSGTSAGGGSEGLQLRRSESSLSADVWIGQRFQVMLVVDVREASARGGGDVLVENLRQLGVPMSLRQLSVGDFMWVLIPQSDTVLRAGVSASEEYFAGILAERKRMDDLAHSIKSRHFSEQKYRMGLLASARVFCIIEDYGSVHDYGLPASSLFQVGGGCRVEMNKRKLAALVDQESGMMAMMTIPCVCAHIHLHGVCRIWLIRKCTTISRCTAHEATSTRLVCWQA
jgi:hypothetical protein